MSFVQRIDELIKGHEANSLAVLGTLAFETSSSFYIFEKLPSTAPDPVFRIHIEHTHYRVCA